LGFIPFVYSSNTLAVACSNNCSIDDQLKDMKASKDRPVPIPYNKKATEKSFRLKLDISPVGLTSV